MLLGERRIRRILPALYAVVIAVFVLAWFFVFPAEMIDLARSMIAVVFFASNILFWHEADYFDAEAIAKPLLHTWSLAVEEQFYLVFPALLLALSKSRKLLQFLLPILAAIGLSSLAYSQWQVRHVPSSAFYLAQGRAWEFVLGAVVAIGTFPASPTSRSWRGLSRSAVSGGNRPRCTFRMGCNPSDRTRLAELAQSAPGAGGRSAGNFFA